MRACVHVCANARTCECQSLRATEMMVGVCMCVCGSLGGGDMVYGCGCEGGQDENSDYTCASYTAY